MKKIIIIVLSFLSIIEIIGCCLVANSNSPIIYGNERKKENSEISDMELVNFNYDRYTISIGKIEIEETVSSKIFVDTYSVEFTDVSQIEKNEIFSKNEVYNGYVFEANSRVMNIENQNVTFENLDSTHITLNLDMSDKITNETTYFFRVKNDYGIINVLNYVISFDKVTRNYKADVFLENDGTYTTGMKVNVSYKKTVLTEPTYIYVPKDYVFLSDDGAFVHKLVSSADGKKYYKVVTVKIEGIYDNYYKVLGELKNENVIILPKYN